MPRATGDVWTVRAVIFDVDGTLIDSVDQHAEAWRQAFAHYGREVSFEAVRQQVGKGGDQLMPMFLYPEELERFGEELADFRARLFSEKFLSQVRPLPGVRDLITRLRVDKKDVALASSAKAEELEAYKRIADITDLIAVETSADDAARSKPHPDIFAAALAQLGGADARHVVVVGDTPYDAQAARKLGITTLGVLSGGFPGPALRAAGCAALFRDVAHLGQVYPFR